MRRVFMFGLMLALAGCSQPAATAPTAEAAKPSAAKLGIRPKGDTEIEPDLTKVPSEELQEGLRLHRRAHRRARREPAEVDPAAEHLQQRRGHSRVGRDGEGLLRQLGCQQARVYDVGITEYGAPGNPVVYAKCDEGAPKTLAIYWQYDTMPVTQPDAWKRRRSKRSWSSRRRTRRCCIGRGATNSKGPRDGAAERAACRSRRSRQAAGQPDLRRRGRRGAHGHRPAQVRQGSPGLLRRRRRDDRRSAARRRAAAAASAAAPKAASTSS